MKQMLHNSASRLRNHFVAAKSGKFFKIRTVGGICVRGSNIAKWLLCGHSKYVFPVCPHRPSNARQCYIHTAINKTNKASESDRCSFRTQSDWDINCGVGQCLKRQHTERSHCYQIQRAFWFLCCRLDLIICISNKFISGSAKARTQAFELQNKLAISIKDGSALDGAVFHCLPTRNSSRDKGKSGRGSQQKFYHPCELILHDWAKHDA